MEETGNVVLALRERLGVKLLREPGISEAVTNSVVPPGLKSYFPLYPALKRGAKLVRPSGAGFSCTSRHQIARK